MQVSCDVPEHGANAIEMVSVECSKMFISALGN